MRCQLLVNMWQEPFRDTSLGFWELWKSSSPGRVSSSTWTTEAGGTRHGAQVTRTDGMVRTAVWGDPGLCDVLSGCPVEASAPT